MHPPPNLPDFDRTSKDALPKDGQFSNWEGKLNFSVYRDTVQLTFVPTCSAQIMMRNTYGSGWLDPNDFATIIRIPSDLSRVLEGAKPFGQTAVVSGKLFRILTASRVLSVLTRTAGNQDSGAFRMPNSSAAASVGSPIFLTKFQTVAIVRSASLAVSCRCWSPETDASPEIAYATAAPMRLGMMYEWPPVVSATKTTAVSGVL
jgi:hypothetical protein